MAESSTGMAGAQPVRPALDRELALSRVGGDLQLLQEIAELFLSDSDRMMSEVDHAVESKDPKALDHAAHTIKGCVSNFGAQALYDAALTLERMGRSGDLTDLHPRYRTLQLEMAQLVKDLRVLTSEL